MNIVMEYQQARKSLEKFELKEDLEKYLEVSIKPIAIQEYNSSNEKLWEYYRNFSTEGTYVSKETLGYNIAAYKFDVFFKYLKMYFYILEKDILELMLSIIDQKEYKEFVVEYFKNKYKNPDEKQLKKYRRSINSYLILMSVIITADNIGIVDMNTILAYITMRQLKRLSSVVTPEI